MLTLRINGRKQEVLVRGVPANLLLRAADDETLAPYNLSNHVLTLLIPNAEGFLSLPGSISGNPNAGLMSFSLTQEQTSSLSPTFRDARGAKVLTPCRLILENTVNGSLTYINLEYCFEVW